MLTEFKIQMHELREDMEKILAIVKILDELEQSETVKEPEQQKKPNPRKIQIDKGKLMALRNAGWSQEKIAEEFGCSTPTIGKALKEIADHEKTRSDSGTE